MLTVALLVCDAVQSDTWALTFQRTYIRRQGITVCPTVDPILRDKNPTYLMPYSLNNDKKKHVPNPSPVSIRLS